MGVNEIKQEIEVCGLRLKRETEALKTLRERIISEIKPYVNEELKRLVESAVGEKPEHTKELGKTSDLAEMRKRLSDLLANSDKIVEKIFLDDELWKHVNYDIVSGGDTLGQRYNVKKKAAEQIEKGIRTILGEAGSILIDYKYAKTDERAYGEWRLISGSVVYGFGLSVPRNIKGLIEQYSNGMGQLHDCIEKINDLKEKLSAQEALDLWHKL